MAVIGHHTFDSGNSPTIPVVRLWEIPLWGICGDEVKSHFAP